MPNVPTYQDVDDFESSINGAPAATPQPEAQPQASQQLQALTFDDLASVLMTGTTLSAAGAEYGRQLEAKLNERNALEANKHQIISMLGNPFEVMDVKSDNSFEGRVIKRRQNDEIVLLVFAETIGAAKFSPADRSVTEALLKRYAKSLNKQVNDIRLLQLLVIHPADYDRVEKMVTFIYNLCTSYRYLNDSLSLKTLVTENGKSYVLYVSTDVELTKNFITALNPQTVNPRADIGFTVFRVEENAYNSVCNNAYNTGFNGVSMDTQVINLGAKPIFAVTGYTKIVGSTLNQFGGMVQQNQNYKTMQPIVTISAIAAPFNTRRFLAPAISIAAYLWLNCSGWLEPFRQYSRKTAPNLGALFAKDGKPGRIENDNDLNVLVNQSFHFPMLQIDVCNGRAMLDGMGAMLMNDAAGLVNEIKQFFGCEDIASPVIPMQLCSPTAHSYSGVYHDATGAWADTREIDYFYLINNNVPFTNEFVEKFLLTRADKDAVARFNELKSYFQDAQPLYDTYSIMLKSADVCNYYTKLMRYVRSNATFARAMYPDFSSIQNIASFGPQNWNFGAGTPMQNQMGFGYFGNMA